MAIVERCAGSLFAKEYKYKLNIEKKSQSAALTFVNSRIKASGISVFALINTSYDLFYMAYHTLGALGYAVIHLSSPLKYCSTTRNIAVFGVDHFRHVLGTFSGSFIGIISPKHATKWLLPPDQTSMETRKGNMTTDQAKRLYEMTGIVHTKFGESEIPYCMTGGTQLGATRHGGLIPWDDDVDLFVQEADKLKIEALKESLEKENIGMIACHLGYKFFDLAGKPISEKNGDFTLDYRYPFIDICCTKKDQKGRITYVNEHFKQNYAGEYLLQSEWDNRELQTFGPLKLYGAPSPEKFCKRMYGDNVFQYGYQLLNHRTFKIEIPRKYYLRKNLDGKCNHIKINNAPT
ncbi:MAG: hypothetical protein CK425_11600 [Parachlamydia sp.]|nr:MAG: hypothetical protein CK425_11600 [Parachlamydia sp.]